MISFKVISILITIIVLIITVKCIDEDSVSVRLKTGVINGNIETSVDNKRVNVFKGIPFAEPPIGDLRFRKPLPLREWPKTLDAVEWPSPCYQTKMFPFVIENFYNKNFSEDCLYLNIWSPENALKSDKLLPVIFYIHGGGLTLGSSAWKVFDMRAITTEGGVVSVSINYRLNTFGFLYTGTEDAPGNVGLWDQALALEWVNDNVRYFGGDPNRITIMGLSAGSWSVSLHLLSPVTRNLFRNAILQSGAYVNYLVDGEYKDQKQLWLKAAELAGCEVGQEFTDEVIECLRKADPETLVDLSFQIAKGGLFPFVIVDGEFLPQSPTEIIRSGDYKQDANLLFGTAQDEGSLFINRIVPDINEKNFTYQEFFEILVEGSPKLSNKFTINGEDVAKIYLNGLSDDNDPGTLKRAIGVAIGDIILACPTILFAKEVFKNSNFKQNVYQYHWNTKLSRSLLPMPDWWGPSHGEDSSPVHGIPFFNSDDFTDSERQLSLQMIQFFTKFAKTGQPGQISGIEWPKYFSIDENIIAPFYDISSSNIEENQFGIGLKISECEYLWKKYLM